MCGPEIWRFLSIIQFNFADQLLLLYLLIYLQQILWTIQLDPGQDLIQTSYYKAMGCLTPGDIHVLFLIINEEKKIIIYKIKIK